MSHTNHSGERELLRLCANRSLSGGAPEQLRGVISEKTDWAYVFSWASEHRLLSLLHFNLREHAAASVPPGVLASLRAMSFLIASGNLRLSGELLRLIELLESNGIEVVPFKGPVLAERLFGSVSLRQFGDLDILVRPRDVHRARQILLADGYKPEFNLSGKFESEYVRSEHAFQFQKKDGAGPDGALVVELHWRFGSRDQAFPISAEDVWPHLAAQTFQGRPIRALSSADLFLYLCMHGAKHAWERLEWILCLTEMIRTDNTIDWNEVTRRAQQRGALRGLHLGLLLAGEYGAHIPVELEQAARRDDAATALARQALSRLFVEEPDHSRREVHRHEFYLRSRERWLDRARIVLFSSARIPHPLAKDWRLFRVPASLSFLFYLLRPIRLMRDYGLRRLRAVVRPATFPEEKYL